MLAGRDLREGGTWLGVTKKGRIAALTVREWGQVLKYKFSLVALSRHFKKPCG
ncbi:MAG: NRDE family protein [Deltaproteobacteria bacterium]|nr:NRDE family protein [Deltaproteobacteria bacterium]